MERQALSARLKEKGKEIGLGTVGIAPLGPADRVEALERWLAEGRAGAMAWMKRSAAERADPRRRFPWAKSAIVAAVPYLPYRGERGAQRGAAAHVARYALGRDYHRVLPRRLRALAAFLASEAPGARTRVYSDTGPLLEKDLAARAGVGWFGKSTNLIGARGDSWTLLGVVLTDVDLPADDRVSDRCGTCTACIDACPTGAIAEPYLVDARRCISYLTIELRGAVPAEQRRDLGDWVFGCDVCQEVCPWNRKVAAASDGEFAVGAHLETRSLADLVRLDEAAFRAAFAETPLERPRRAGLVRNAIIVAANTGDGEALAAAAERLDDADPVVRETAAWALEDAGTSRT